MKRFAALFKSRIPHVLTLSAAVVVVEVLRNRALVETAPGQPHLALALETFANWTLMGLVIVAIICACQLALRPGWRRIAVQAVALALGTLAYAEFVGTSPWLTIWYRTLGFTVGPAMLMYLTWLGWATSALLSAFYGAHERARSAAAALRAAHLARERTQHELLEARLQVLEAQVEPRFLFDALSRVQHLYDEDARRADQALDDLIGYLRAALPQSREHASTLGRELDLAQAYLRIVSTAAHEIRRPGGAAEDAYAPPMVLLPMVQLAHAARPRLEASLEMRADEMPGYTRVEVSFPASGDWEQDPRVRSLRATLALLFGGDGALEIVTARGRTTLSVSWPSMAAAPVPARQLA